MRQAGEGPAPNLGVSEVKCTQQVIAADREAIAPITIVLFPSAYSL